jgi:hypothetical protein
MKKSIEFENQQPFEIKISEIPSSIDLNGIVIRKSMCIENSYQVAKKYPKVGLVEGLIVTINFENRGKPMPHMWNMFCDVHFDVTKERVWMGNEEMVKTKDIKYFVVKYHNQTDFKIGELFEFCKDTIQYCDEIKDKLSKIEQK